MEVYLESMSRSYRKSVYDRVFSQTVKIQEITNSILFLFSDYLYHKNKIQHRQYLQFRIIATAINIGRKIGRKLVLSWMWVLSGYEIFNDVDTQMVTVKPQSECLLEMNEVAYDSEILFQNMIGAVFRHHINYTFSHDKDFFLTSKSIDYTKHQPKKTLYSEKWVTVSNEGGTKFTEEFYFTLDGRFG